MEDVEQCLIDCAAAVRRDPTYVKAGYRAVQALQLKVRDGLVWCMVLCCGMCLEGGVVVVLAVLGVGIVLWCVWRRAKSKGKRREMRGER